jgi:uncharacterized protein
MSKDDIKKQLLQALEKDPLKERIKRASLFGSYLHGESSDNSDVDVLIEFKPSAKVGYFELADIQENLEQSIGRKVDLLTPRAISKYFRDRVLAEAELIYEG